MSDAPVTPAPAARTWTLAEHAEPVSVVRLPAATALPDWADGEPLISVTWTRDETSIVCPSRSIPDALPGSVIGPYVVFQVAGVLDHTLTGVLASLLAPLAEAEIPILSVATYDTEDAGSLFPGADQGNGRVATVVWAPTRPTLAVETELPLERIPEAIVGMLEPAVA